MTQKGLFDAPPESVYDRYRAECAETARLFAPVAPGSATSAEAAASLSSSVLGQQAACVLEALKASPDGLTCDALEAATGLRHQSASARLWGLRKQGQVQDSGRVAPTRSGRSAVVWVAV